MTDVRQNCIVIRVDIDTGSGINYGLPKLLQLFAETGLKASFFVPAGPDRSGLALKRVFNRPGFLKRMWKLKAPMTYGFQTLLAGTLIPPVFLIQKYRKNLTGIIESGHELNLHGYDHFFWQGKIDKLTFVETADLIDKAFKEFETCFGQKPTGFACPGWIYNQNICRILDRYQLLYSSDCRGRFPFLPCFENYRGRTLQIPVTLPTIDELLVFQTEKKAYEILTTRLSSQKMAVHVIHTEIEGKNGFQSFKTWLKLIAEKGIKFKLLNQIALELRDQTDRIPYYAIKRGNLPGRFDHVAIQEKESDL